MYIFKTEQSARILFVLNVDGQQNERQNKVRNTHTISFRIYLQHNCSSSWYTLVLCAPNIAETLFVLHGLFRDTPTAPNDSRVPDMSRMRGCLSGQVTVSVHFYLKKSFWGWRCRGYVGGLFVGKPRHKQKQETRSLTAVACAHGTS